jgi:hypothetical protein
MLCIISEIEPDPKPDPNKSRTDNVEGGGTNRARTRWSEVRFGCLASLDSRAVYLCEVKSERALRLGRDRQSATSARAFP